MHEEWLNMKGSYVRKQMMGQDPIRKVDPIARNVSTEVAESFIVPEWARRSVARKKVLEGFMDHPAVKLYENQTSRFRAHNESVLKNVVPGMSQPDMMLALQGLERMPVDEADEQSMLSYLNEVQLAVQEIDPSFSVKDDPLLAKMARSIEFETTPMAAAEAEGTTAVGRTARAALSGFADPATDFLGKVGDGFTELSMMVLGGMDSDFAHHYRAARAPDKFLLDRDGKIVNNGGKIGRSESPYLTWKLMTGMAVGDIEKEATAAKEAIDWDNAQVKDGLESAANGIAGTVGFLGAFGFTGGGVLMQSATKAMHQGAARFLARSTPKMARRADIVLGIGGTAVGTAIWEMGMYGDVDGYGKAARHGAQMGLPFWLAGRMGKHMEKVLAKYPKMPLRLRKQFEGMVEGATMSATEMAGLSSSLWNFMRNPEDRVAQRDWSQSLLTNVMGIGLFKAMTGRTPFEQRQMMDVIGAEGIQSMNEARATTEARRKTARRTKDPEARAKKFGVEPETFREFTEKTQEYESSRGARQKELRQELGELEKRMDIEAFAPKEKAQTELEQISKEEVTGEELRMQPEFGEEGIKEREAKEEPFRLREELDRLKAQKMTPESFREVTELLKKAKGEPLAKMAEGFGKQIEEQGRIDQAMIKELGEAQLTVLAMKFGVELGTLKKMRGAKESPEVDVAFREQELAEMMGARSSAALDAARAEYKERLDKGEAIPQDDPGRQRLGELETEGVETPTFASAQVGRPISLFRGIPTTPTSAVEFYSGSPLIAESYAKKRGSGEIAEMSITPEKIFDATRPIPSEVMDRLEAAGAEKAAVSALRGIRQRGDLVVLKGVIDQSPRLFEAMRAEGYDLAVFRDYSQVRDNSFVILGAAKAPAPIEIRAEGKLGSIKAGELPMEAVEGVEKATLDDIYAEMSGRLPRAGVRIPFSEKRMGSKEGDPVRPEFRKGRIGGGKGVLGLYKIFENLVRTRQGQTLVTRAHEWSHAMQRHMISERGGTEFLDANKVWTERLPADVLAEFPAILEGYNNWQALSVPRQAMEVWAEWHARRLLSDETLDAQAPRLSEFFEAQLAHKSNRSIRDQFDRIQKAILNYKLIGAKGRLRESRIGVSEKPSEAVKASKPTLFEQKRDTFLKGWVDSKVNVRREIDKWIEGRGIDAAEVSIREDMVRMHDVLAMTAPKQAEQFIVKGVKLADGTRVPGMGDVWNKAGERIEDFKDYLVAVLNSQRIMRGKVGTLSKAEYVSEVRRLQTENPDFRQMARDFKASTDSIVDWVAETGNLPVDRAERIKDSYVAWVPFLRAMETPSVEGGAMGGKTPREGIGKVRGGGEERIRDPFMSMFEVVTQMISNAHRNMVMAAGYKMGVGYEAGGLVTKVNRTIQPKEHPLAEILDAIERQVELPGEGQFWMEDVISSLRDADALDAQTVTLFAQKATPYGEKNTIAFVPRMSEAEIIKTARGDKALEKIIRGDQDKTLWLELNPELYDLMVGLDVPPSYSFFEDSIVGGALRQAAKLKRAFATELKPAFSLANAFRDATSYPVFDAEGKFAPGGGFFKLIQGGMLYHMDKGPEGMREIYEASGIKMSTLLHEGARKEMIGEVRGLKDKTAAALQKVKEMVGAPENYIRIKVMETTLLEARAAGKPEAEARLLASEAGRESTINYARGGIYAKIVNQMTPYFGAEIQAHRKLWRSLVSGGDGKNDAQRARLQKAAWVNGIANITVPSMLLWWMNHEEEWYQDLPGWRKLMFFNMKITDDFTLSLPKPFEVGLIFGGLPEMAMEKWVSENGKPPTMYDVIGNGMFRYLKGVGELLPAASQPVLETQFDWQIFQDRELTPEWLRQSRVREEQATFYTTETAQVLSRAINGAMTPIQIEKILGGYTAGGLTWGMRVLDEMSGMKDHPGWAINPLSRFFTQPHKTGFHQDRFYDISQELDQLAGSDRATRADSRLRTQVNRAKRKISDIRRDVRDGKLDSIEADRLIYQIARPLVERYEESR